MTPGGSAGTAGPGYRDNQPQPVHPPRPRVVVDSPDDRDADANDTADDNSGTETG